MGRDNGDPIEAMMEKDSTTQAQVWGLCGHSVISDLFFLSPTTVYLFFHPFANTWIEILTQPVEPVLVLSALDS